METPTKTRIEQITTALELGVDIDDFRFESFAERRVWIQLDSEVSGRLERGDCAWSVDVA